jgi:hypothetical protein
MKWLTANRLMGALVALVLVMGGANLLASRQYLDSYKAGQARQQAAQRATGILLEQKLCLDLGTMAGIPAPPGAAAANPSRAYEQAESRAWKGLYSGLGCSRVPR